MFVAAQALVACGPPGDADDDLGDAVDAGAIDAPLASLTSLWPDAERERAGFGRAMAKSGNTLVIGASQSPVRVGAAYVFVWRDGAWRQQAKLTGDADAVAFAEDLAIAGDTIVVTERMPGATPLSATPTRALVFTRSGEAWALAATLGPAQRNSAFGRSIAIQGDTIVVGDAAAHVYERDGAGWAERQMLVPPDAIPSPFYAAAIEIDGDRIAVSDPMASNAASDTPGNVSLFGRDADGVWRHTGTVTPPPGPAWPDGIGYGDSLALEGGRLAVGVSHSHCVEAWVYELEASTWNRVAILDPNHNACGRQTARVAMDGERVAVASTGAFNDNPVFQIDGAAYVFEKTSAGWNETPVTTVRPPGAVTAGTSILFAGDTLLIGAPGSATVYLWAR